ncbi:MAG: NUDIX hydrolase [Gammaproteobacteria bacterium]|nr:NUDIX hydrolase [Gammaproteobacteria bacterium]
MKFCNQCGEAVVFRVPEGDNRKRFLCESCGAIHYQNPRIITGCLAVWENQVLLCRRSIQPRKGFWTLPAGFLENGETAKGGAERETWEEARARVSIIDLYTMFSLPHISQIYLFYRARLIDGDFAPGEETEAVGLFHEADIPWDELAFPVIRDTLKHYFRDLIDNRFKVHTGDIEISRNRS